MKPWMVVKELLGVLLFASAVFGEDVRISTTPENFIFAAQDNAVRITVTVEPHPDNRELMIYWSQENGETDSSHIQLDVGSPRQFQLLAKHLRPGILYIRACLERSGSIHLRFKQMEVK